MENDYLLLSIITQIRMKYPNTHNCIVHFSDGKSVFLEIWNILIAESFTFKNGNVYIDFEAPPAVIQHFEDDIGNVYSIEAYHQMKNKSFKDRLKGIFSNKKQKIYLVDKEFCYIDNTLTMKYDNRNDD